MRRLPVLFVLALACSRETPAPPPQPAATSQAPAPVAVAPQPKASSYEDAMTWFRTANAFHFVVDESGVHAVGDVKRPRIGEEQVQFRANGAEWLAKAGPRGVTWQRREGGAWKDAPPPELGPRLYQRVTVAFDPQKKEGAAQLAGDEGGAAHYRFTNANSGEVHDVWVRDGRIERITIGNTFEMKISS